MVMPEGMTHKASEFFRNVEKPHARSKRVLMRFLKERCHAAHHYQKKKVPGRIHDFRGGGVYCCIPKRCACMSAWACLSRPDSNT